jgi:DNA-binding transcriptional MerR regulator
MENSLPPIPVKRYFTIGEVGDLCGVKPHVLRYWEQEFTQLRPMKRRGNRRYYQHHEVLMIRRIRICFTTKVLPLAVHVTKCKR